MQCANFEKCPFVKYCDEVGKQTAVAGFITMYCKGDRMSSCVRLKLCSAFSREVVPKNMMPNGFPISGTSRDGWDERAINYRHYVG